MIKIIDTDKLNYHKVGHFEGANGYVLMISKSELERAQSTLEEIAGRFCDDYCKWPEKYESEGKLWDEHCNKCPISLLT